jgi:CHAD domain-containing protein
MQRALEPGPDPAIDAGPEAPRTPPAEARLVAFARSAVEAVEREREALLRSADKDTVHRARTAVRKLRTALLLFPASPADELGIFRDPLRDLSRALGEVRDLDVFVGTLSRLEFEVVSQLAPLASWAAVRRAGAGRQLVNALRQEGISQATAELSARLAQRSDETFGDRGDGATEILERAWRALRRYEGEIARLGPHRRHKVRIRARRLQVALEIFGPSTVPNPPDEPSQKFLGRLDRLQRRLGELNDIATAARLLDAIEADGAAQGSLIRDVRKALKARGRRIEKRATRAFDKLARAKKRWSWSETPLLADRATLRRIP